MPRKAIDPALASPFHLEWLVAMDGTSADDYARAVAEKAEALVRAAHFLDAQRASDGTDAEVRVWIEAACGSACVSITYEPGVARHGFYLLDETLRERLGCVVFEAFPCISAPQSEAQADQVFAAALDALAKSAARQESATAWADDVRHALAARRVPIQDAKLDLDE